jgi:glycosyltransferase involved in cell wall biosynthesis
MSFYDAQSCGSPVISENNNVNLDRNSHGNGFCFKIGNKEDFILQLEKIINLSNDEYNLMRKKSLEFILKNYSYEIIAKKYTEEIQKTIDRFNEINQNKKSIL